jgi:Protein of unknown function (DUF2939)
MSKALTCIIVAVVSLTGCATTPGPSDASEDVRAFARALRDRNISGIETRIDRPALQGQVTGLARAIAAEEISKRTGASPLLGMLGADLASPIIETLARRALEPDMLADIAFRGGLTAETPIPGRMVTAIVLRRVPDGRVCAPDPQTKSCLLYFGKYPTGWKLNAIDETALRARLAPQPTPARRRS